MKALNWYNGASILLHALLILWLLGVGVFHKTKPLSDVFQVDLVTDIVSENRTIASADAQGSDYVFDTNNGNPVTLSGVKKEEALPDLQIEPLPSMEEASAEKDKSMEPNSSPALKKDTTIRTIAPLVTGLGTIENVSNEVSYLQALWISQIKELVYSLWKMPPEISLV